MSVASDADFPPGQLLREIDPPLEVDPWRGPPRVGLPGERWDVAVRQARRDADRENAKDAAMRQAGQLAPAGDATPLVVEDRGDGVRVTWCVPGDEDASIAAIDIHDPDRPRSVVSDTAVLRLHRLRFHLADRFSIPVAAAGALVLTLWLVVQLCVALDVSPLFALAAGLVGAGAVGFGLREVTRRRWRRVELPTGDGEFDHRLRRLVDAHALASTRGDGHVGAAMLVGAGRRRLWETLGLLEDLDPDVHVADAHELVVSLDQVEAMHATAERSPAPHQPRSAKEIRRQVRAQRALERSASASVQLRSAIDDLDADHEAMGR